MTPEETLACFLAKHPLTRFSFYSQMHADILRDASAQISSLLDESINEEEFVNGRNLQVIYGRFWMWVLGSYEFTRTMSE